MHWLIVGIGFIAGFACGVAFCVGWAALAAIHRERRTRLHLERIK